MYLRATVLLVAIGAGVCFLLQAQQRSSQPRAIDNPYVDSSSSETAAASPGWTSRLTVSAGIGGWQPWHYIAGGIGVLAIAVAGILDFRRSRQRIEQPYAYYTPTPHSAAKQPPNDDDAAPSENPPEHEPAEMAL